MNNMVCVVISDSDCTRLSGKVKVFRTEPKADKYINKQLKLYEEKLQIRFAKFKRKVQD